MCCFGFIYYTVGDGEHAFQPFFSTKKVFCLFLKYFCGIVDILGNMLIRLAESTLKKQYHSHVFRLNISPYEMEDGMRFAVAYFLLRVHFLKIQLI